MIERYLEVRCKLKIKNNKIIKKINELERGGVGIKNLVELFSIMRIEPTKKMGLQDMSQDFAINNHSPHQ